MIMTRLMLILFKGSGLYIGPTLYNIRITKLFRTSSCDFYFTLFFSYDRHTIDV